MPKSPLLNSFSPHNGLTTAEAQKLANNKIQVANDAWDSVYTKNAHAIILYVAFSITIIKCNPFTGNRISISSNNLILIFPM